MEPLYSKVTQITGTINYIGGVSSWLPDSVVNEVRVVAFQYVPNSSDSILSNILNETAFFTQDTLPRYVAKSDFVISITKSPVDIKYLAVVKYYGNNYLSDWRVIGIYTEPNNDTIPNSIYVEKGKTFNVNINVSLNHLPPQPF